MQFLEKIDPILYTSFIGSEDPRHWAAREIALEMIKAVERQTDAAKRAGSGVWSGGYDGNGDPELVENIEPWEILVAYQALTADNPNARAILEAEHRLVLLGREVVAPMQEA